MLGPRKIIGICISLIVLAVTLPIALGYIAGMEYVQIVNQSCPNKTMIALKDVLDVSLLQLVTVVLPLIAVIGIIIYYIPKFKE